MGMSSLETVVSISEMKSRFRSESNIRDNDAYWYQREMKRNSHYLSGPVTVIKFDYLENN